MPTAAKNVLVRNYIMPKLGQGFRTLGMLPFFLYYFFFTPAIIKELMIFFKCAQEPVDYLN